VGSREIMCFCQYIEYQFNLISNHNYIPENKVLEKRSKKIKSVAEKLKGYKIRKM
jgi:hypothetical protein